MDDQQRAMELLAQAYEKLGEYACAAMTRSGRHEHRAALDAITAALRAAPEGFVMVPVEPTTEMVDAFNRRDELPYPEKNRRAYKAIHCYAALLAARPQGVKDV